MAFSSAKGLLVKASELHYKAAEAFQKCVERSTDEHVCLLKYPAIGIGIVSYAFQCALSSRTMHTLTHHILA